MKTYNIPIKRLSPCGMIVKIDTVVKLIAPSVASFDFWHDGQLIGNILCEVENIQVFDAIDFLIKGYFKSEKFKTFRKEVENDTE